MGLPSYGEAGAFPLMLAGVAAFSETGRLAGPPVIRVGAGSGAEVVVIKVDIVNQVINRTGVSKSKAEMAVETIFEAMKQALQKGERIELRGFGVFTVRPRKTGIGRNPRTGEEVAIPPGKAIRFKPGKELQDLT